MKVLTGIGLSIGAVAVLAIVLIGGAIATIGWNDTFGTWVGVSRENRKTEVIRQSNQYVTSANAAALAHIDDYVHADTDGQRIYIVGQVWNDVSGLTPDNYVPEVARFLNAHPRGSK